MEQGWRFEVDKPFTVIGTIRRGEGEGTWWLIYSANLPVPTELSGLDPQFQREGLRVALTGHLEADRIATNGWMLLFVDDVVLA